MRKIASCRYLIAALLSLVCSTSLAQQPQVSPRLWELLNQWSEGSAEIDYLHGHVERHIYNKAYRQDQFSRCELWFGAPDKGRLDIHPVKITQRMIEERKTARGVERDEKGNPYKLVSGDPLRWLCDGERVYEINDQEKTAQVAVLPPELRGQNIMNTSLPFLFGLPPRDAIERFDITIQKDDRPAGPYVFLEVKPKTQRDSEWIRSLVILDTRTWLPNAVKIYDTTDSPTVYTFKELKTGEGIIRTLFPKSPWNPRVNGYAINMVSTGGKPIANSQRPGPNQPANTAYRGKVVPNLVDMSHQDATAALVAAGIPKDKIRIRDAGPAPTARDTYRVRGQNPQANTALNVDGDFILYVFNKPAAVQNVGGQR